jgi:hypothetical protein
MGGETSLEVTYLFAGFEVITAVVIKSYVFWDITDVSDKLVASIFQGRTNMSPLSSE